MNDFMQCIRDWKEYKRRHPSRLGFYECFPGGMPRRSIFWFLCQSPEKRIIREEREIEELEEVIEEVERKIKERSNK